MPNNNTLPDWMIEHPIPEIRNAIQQAQIQKQKYEESKFMNNNPLTPPDPATVESDSPDKKIFNNGTVLLVWKERGNETVISEADKFPTKSSFYISKFQDYNSKEEMQDIVVSFQKFVSEYNQLPDRKGVYAIVLSKMVKDVKTKQKVVESVEIEFE